MSTLSGRALGLLLAGTLGMLAGCGDSANERVIERTRADMAIAWNERLLAIADAEDRFLTLKGVRTAAMMHAAMHDALNAVHRRYHPYLFATDAPRANPAAVAPGRCGACAPGRSPLRSPALRHAGGQ